jgi:hypothetical protein
MAAASLSLEWPRRLTAPARSFFLFGPRGTGKSTWLRQHFPRAVLIDLLLADVPLELGLDVARWLRLEGFRS